MNSDLPRRSSFALARAASALLVAALLGACGRGPLTPPPISVVGGTIQFQLIVAGAITPAQGDYIIAVNAVTADGTSVNPGEPAGMPTVAEAQAGSFTHWDQEFVYGFDTTAAPNGFNYAYKALGTGGIVTFVPIILTTNQFIFNPSLSTGTGVNNTLSITLPIAALSIRSNPNGTQPPTVSSPAAVLLHVNYITTDNSPTHVPQDQLGCCSLLTSGYDLPVDLTKSATYFNQLTSPPTKSGPANPNLFIAGGQIIVTPG
ncbi:MAG TPA: hypothetical protein VKF82_00640 [Candidatus Eremiobacteraceae bacterium]|nr:hypothetical protein [Candidatus Eremiobacteraceae bacterium]